MAERMPPNPVRNTLVEDRRESFGATAGRLVRAPDERLAPLQQSAEHEQELLSANASWTDREYWSTRQFLWNSTRSGWLWFEDQLLDFGRQFFAHQAWQLTVFAGAIALVLTLISISAAVHRDRLLTEVFPSPRIEPRYPTLPAMPDVILDTRLTQLRRPRVTQSLSLNDEVQVRWVNYVSAPREPRPLREPIRDEFESVPVVRQPQPVTRVLPAGQPELDLSVRQTTKRKRPAPITLPLPVEQLDEATNDLFAHSHGDLLARLRADNWQRYRPGQSGTDPLPERYQDRDGRGAAALRRANTAIDETSGGLASALLPSSLTASVQLSLLLPEIVRAGEVAQLAVVVKNTSDFPFDWLELDEEMGLPSIVSRARPAAAVISDSELRRALPNLASGQSEKLLLEWYSNRPKAVPYRARLLAETSVSAVTNVQPEPAMVTQPRVTEPEIPPTAPVVSSKPAISIRFSTVGRVRVGDQVPLNIVVENIGEVDLHNVRVTADLPPEVAHRYGATLQFRVGELRRHQSQTTLLLLDGRTVGVAVNKLRAVADEVESPEQTARVEVLPPAPEGGARRPTESVADRAVLPAVREDANPPRPNTPAAVPAPANSIAGSTPAAPSTPTPKVVPVPCVPLVMPLVCCERQGDPWPANWPICSDVAFW